MSNTKTSTEPIQRRSTFVEPSESKKTAEPSPAPEKPKVLEDKPVTAAVTLAGPSAPVEPELAVTPPKPAVPARELALEDASEAISHEREEQYGDPQGNFGRIAGIWTSILGQPVTEKQVALMMAGLKIARLAHDGEHHDSWVDLIGYGALGSEVDALTQAERNERAKVARA